MFTFKFINIKLPLIKTRIALSEIDKGSVGFEEIKINPIGILINDIIFHENFDESRPISG